MDTWIAVSENLPLSDVPADATVLLGSTSTVARVAGKVFIAYGKPRRNVHILRQGGRWDKSSRPAELPCRLAVKARVIRGKSEEPEVRRCAHEDCGKILPKFHLNRRYCSDTCKSRAYLDRKREKKAATQVATAPQPIACAYAKCAATIDAPNPGQMYCGELCSMRAWRAKQLEKAREPKPAPSTESVQEPPWVVRVCEAEGCGTHLTKKQKRFCSKQCCGAALAASVNGGYPKPKPEPDEEVERPKRADGVRWEANTKTAEDALKYARANVLEVTRLKGGVIETVTRGFGGGWLLMRKVGTAIEFPRVFQDHKRDLAARGLIEIFGGADGRDIMAAWDRAGAKRRAG